MCNRDRRRKRERESERESQAGSVLSVQGQTQGSISGTARSLTEPKSIAGCLTDAATQAPLATCFRQDLLYTDTLIHLWLLLPESGRIE